MARATGLGAVARLTASVLYMCSGQIAGKFNMGHFQLGVSLAWPPLVLAGVWWTLTTDRRWPKALTAFAFAMLFFSGNIYYTLHTLLSAGVIALVFMVRRPRRKGGWSWRTAVNRGRLRAVVIAGAFAVGLSAVQVLPIWAARAYISHPGDPALRSRSSVEVALAGYLQPHPEWARLKADNHLFEGVEYAYVGPLAFVALGLPLLYVRRRDPDFDWRAPAVAVILFVLMFAWATGASPLFNWLYARVDLLAQFRYIGRAHAFGVLWLAIMIGLVVDVGWRLIWRMQWPQSGRSRGRNRGLRPAQSPVKRPSAIVCWGWRRGPR
ncbi:MAG: hypothetical protein M5R40_23260 [Anaerolineae bacterium]|nr:hypothetical protein [Anaerolineae bacterium]